MKGGVPLWCLVLLSTAVAGAARASDGVPSAPAPRPAVVDAASGNSIKTPPPAQRRSRMAEPDDGEKPSFSLSAAYKVIERDEAASDRCMKYTGSRLKRRDGGGSTCTIGNGQVFVPKR